MPIDRKSAADYARSIIDEGERLNDAIYDFRFGPIADTCVRPPAVVLEDVNADLRDIDSKLTLFDPTVFEGDNVRDLTGIAYNSGIQTTIGSPSRGTFYAISRTGPTTTQDVVIPRGYPISCTGTGGEVVVFSCDEDVRVPFADAPAYRDATRGLYRIPVAATSTTRGDVANVAPNSVLSGARALPLISSFELPVATSGGREPTGVEEIIQLILLADRGGDARLASGLESTIRLRFPEVASMAFAGPGNPLLIRSEESALDVFIQGTSSVFRREVVTYTGAGHILPLSTSPVISVQSVRRLLSPQDYAQDTDYEFVPDSTGLSASVRAVDGIRFDSGGLVVPDVGDALLVEYYANSLIRDLQAEFDTNDSLRDDSRSLLFRAGTARSIVLSYRVKLFSRFSATETAQTTLTNISTIIQDHVNGLGMGQPVERFDINALVSDLSAVDNFEILGLYFDGDPVSVSDLTLATNEYATISTLQISGSNVG